MKPGHRVRQVANAANTSTLLGLAVAKAGQARLEPGPHGLVLADGYRLRVPTAPAFTVGNVVLVRDRAIHERRPRLLVHEARHATQWAWCLGPVFLMLYAVASLWSWALTGDSSSRNVFERLAGLADGGYRERPLRWRRGPGRAA